VTKSEAYKRRIIVTGGAGFIGSNLLIHLVPKYPEYLFVNVDCLTYAGNLSNLSKIASRPNYRFEKIDIRDSEGLHRCFDSYDPDGLIHLAAESHVDRSIMGPAEFISTNITGTFNLLELARRRADDFRFLHISTDEVYGSLAGAGSFSEKSPYNPSSPYAASKAAADHLVNAYHVTYGLDSVTSNCSNNFGPYQFPEKLIPLTIRNAQAGLPIPIYGDGQNIRDWMYVEDHCRGIELVFHKGKAGETYNIGADNRQTNVDVVRKVCRILDRLCGGGPREKFIEFIKDRPGHDRHYAMDASRIKSELGWEARFSFDEGLETTIGWYLDNAEWLENCISGEYLRYYDKMYAKR
jgi:dTDP-glucose 4,6-dehydratase